MAKKCIVCTKRVDWEEVKETFEDYFEQADGYGMESLGEPEQQVVSGKICSRDCYETL